MAQTNNKNQTACRLIRNYRTNWPSAINTLKCFICHIYLFFFTAAHLCKLDKNMFTTYFFASHIVDWNVKKKSPEWIVDTFSRMVTSL